MGFPGKIAPQEGSLGRKGSAWRLLVLFLVAFILLAAMILNLEALERRFIFFPERLPRDYSFETLSGRNGKELFLRTRDGVEINALFYPGERQFAILYLHGNAGSLRDWQYVAEELAFLQASLLILDYRGYGKSQGKPTEKGLALDGEAAYLYLKGQGFGREELILYGRSLGSYPALVLAKELGARGVILETPFLSLQALARVHYPFLPSFLPRFFPMNNGVLARGISLPVLLLHGDQDEIVPLSQAKELARSFPGKVELVVIPGGHHNDLPYFPQHREVLHSFLASLFPEP